MTRCSVSGEEPVNPDNSPVPNSTTRPDGQHVDHWVMCAGEIIKAGFVRPIRDSYVHVGPLGPKYPLRDLTANERMLYNLEDNSNPYVKYETYPLEKAPAVGRFWTQAELDAVGKGCGTKTSMLQAIAQTYAANPGYYGSTFCCGCGKYFPVGRRGEFVWDGTSDRVGT